MVFLTDVDPRAAVRGSRDPLALVPLWSHFGRAVVGTLTTVTSSPRGFTTVLLACHFARAVQERDPGGQTTLQVFLKFEQLAGYCRHYARKDMDIRGIERIRYNLAQSPSVRLSASRVDDQILSNQKVYGLWGLYSSSARAAGLLESEEPVLTPAAREFVERQYLSLFTREGLHASREFVELLRKPHAEVHLAGNHARLASALAKALAPTYTHAERDFYREHLVFGGPQDLTSGRQRLLADAIGQLPDGTDFDRQELLAVIKAAQRRGKEWSALTERLERIDHLETVLALSGLVFGFLQERAGAKLAEVAAEIGRSWGPRVRQVNVDAVRALLPELKMGTSDETTAAKWVRIAEALSAGEYDVFLKQLLDHNAAIMRLRNGSDPWIRLEHGRLNVRYREQPATLPSKQDLPRLWVNTYFLNSMKAVTKALAA